MNILLIKHFCRIYISEKQRVAYSGTIRIRLLSPTTILTHNP